MKAIKKRHLDALADHVRGLYRAPQLRQLFLELTLQCNERCFHCGSSCTAETGEVLSAAELCAVLDQIHADFAPDLPELYVTGGEPLLRRDFFEILRHAQALGFRWGMTSNATLITPEAARRLADCGMSTISVSIDGLPETHDRLRGMPGGFDLAMRGIEALLDVGTFRNVQVTTVVNHENLHELDALFEILDGVDIDSWRVIHLEPIGRALQHPELMCTPEDYRRLFDFIRDKRRAGCPVEFGCSHYLGPDYEREVRDWYWLCNAGIYTASIMANGDIGACLDIERRPETIQGNIRRDRFRDVWENRFGLFRRDLSEGSAFCAGCDHIDHCRGDAHHSWNYDKNEPMVCFRGTLFD